MGRDLVGNGERISEFDKQVAIYMVKGFGLSLKKLKPSLKDNEEVVWEAVSNNPYAFAYASDRLRGDRHFVLRMITEGHSGVFRSALDCVKADKEVALAAVRVNKGALYAASSELRDDEGVVSTAIRTGWKAIASASDRLRKNPKMLGLALESRSELLRSPNVDFGVIENTKESLEKAFGQSDWLYPAADEIKDNKQLLMAEIEKPQSAFVLKLVSDRLKSDKELFLRAVVVHGEPIMTYASEGLKAEYLAWWEKSGKDSAGYATFLEESLRDELSLRQKGGLGKSLLGIDKHMVSTIKI